MPAPPPMPRDFASHSLERKCQKNSATEEDGVHRSWSRSREINRSPASLCPSSSVAFSSSLVLPIPPTPQILRIGFSGRTSWTLWTLANRSKKWRRSSLSCVRSVKSFRADCRAARWPAALMDLRIGINAKPLDAKAIGILEKQGPSGHRGKETEKLDSSANEFCLSRILASQPLLSVRKRRW